MSVRKRTWKTPNGTKGQAWIVDYADHLGKRRQRSFDTKGEADAYHISVSGESQSMFCSQPRS